MKIKILLILGILISQFTYSQQSIPTFPNGVYSSIEQLKNRKPEYQIDFLVKQLDSSSKSDFLIFSKVDSIKPRHISKNVLAYSKNDSLFININKLKITDKKFFSLVLTKGNFLAFKAPVSSDAVIVASLFGGIVGGLIASAVTADIRHLYVLSLRTGNTRALTYEYMQERLKDYPSMLTEYNNTPNNRTETVLIDYINKLNKILNAGK